jgi:hypothetical protein
MAKAVTLVHPNAALQVPVELLVNKGNLFADGPGLVAFPYRLKYPVSPSDFLEFVSALKGTTAKVAINDFKGLSQLSEEFRFRDLEHSFRNSALPKISRKLPKLK